MTTYKEELGRRLERFIIDNALKKSDFAGKIGVDHAHQQKWIRGETSPSAERLGLISKCYKKQNLEWLLTGTYKDSLESELEFILQNLIIEIGREVIGSKQTELLCKWEIGKKYYLKDVREYKDLNELINAIELDKNKKKKTIETLLLKQKERREIAELFEYSLNKREGAKEDYQDYFGKKLEKNEQSIKSFLFLVKKRCSEINPTAKDILIHA